MSTSWDEPAMITQEPEEYEVERIVDKRTRDGRIEYFLKWVGYPSTANTWERQENLNCPKLIAQYEEERRRKSSKRKRRSSGKHESIDSAQVQEKQISGFDQGWEVDKIIGATDAGGELKFLIKWKNSDYGELVPSAIANIKIPQTVIKFYEERLITIPRKPEQSTNVAKTVDADD